MFADLKNDFVFRRVFAQHAELTQALLNDLLALEGPERIVELSLLAPEQAPVVAGAKLSILDLKARDQSGRTFVVEVQLLHVGGFLNRVVYNACKAYVAPLAAGKNYTGLRDVWALSLCDFVIWPQHDDAASVPLVSRWALTEEQSGTKDLRQVQYVFVELPKIAQEAQPRTAAEQWAWLFKYGRHLQEMPTGLTPAQTQTLQWAEEATFTLEEAEAYRRVNDEIEQARQLAEEGETRGVEKGKKLGLDEGKKLGLDEGKKLGLRQAIGDLCEAYGIDVEEAKQAYLARLGLEELDALRNHLKAHKKWPEPQGEDGAFVPS